MRQAGADRVRDARVPGTDTMLARRLRRAGLRTAQAHGCSLS